MPKKMPKPEAAAMPPIVALNGPHPSAATMSGSGAMMESSNETGTPDIVEANISADAQPATRPMRIIAIISCPAPFERLEVVSTPTIGDRTTRKPYEELRPAARRPPVEDVLANDVGQQAEETRALDGAGELTLLLGGHGGDAARHDLAALGDVTHQQLGILVVDLRRIRTRERAGLAAAEKRTACSSFSHGSYSSSVASTAASSRGRRGPRSPRKPPPSRSPRKPPSRSPRKPPPRSSRSRSRSALRIIADGPSSCSSTRTLR